jgi:hypothetical protein
MDSLSQRDIGRMEADIDNLKITVATMSEDVKAIRKMLDEARGGTKILLWSVGAVSGGIGAGIVKLIATFKGGG